MIKDDGVIFFVTRQMEKDRGVRILETSEIDTLLQSEIPTYFFDSHSSIEDDENRCLLSKVYLVINNSHNKHHILSSQPVDFLSFPPFVYLNKKKRKTDRGRERNTHTNYCVSGDTRGHTTHRWACRTQHFRIV